MNTRPEESNEYSSFLSYEIFDTGRFTSWSVVTGLLAVAIAAEGFLAAETPSELGAKCAMSVLFFAGSMLASLRAEDRDVQKARSFGRHSVFNGYRQMFPEHTDNQNNNIKRFACN